MLDRVAAERGLPEAIVLDNGRVFRLDDAHTSTLLQVDLHCPLLEAAPAPLVGAL